DAGDLDLLAQAQVGGDTSFDLTGDSATNFDDRIRWVRDLKHTWIGDANLDGEFNSTDFVSAFTAGKYESGGAATWSEGDWDGDLDFDSGDFVAAFSDGGYEAGVRPSVAAVPEPASGMLAIMSLLGLARWRRRAN
ncbi:MAG: PEP-CTERM sorting domain-containing protein, partial [Planctomycetales bacterium]|nr:PEP-CTERM sorting domain-containing protein [Planctomycetales bacterium]